MSKVMAAKEVKQVLRVVPEFLSMPFNRIWSSYDREADVLYINFKKPSHADNSELTMDSFLSLHVIRSPEEEYLEIITAYVPILDKSENDFKTRRRLG